MINGTHGTFMRNKKAILASGFKLPQKPGMFGSGVYFWRDENYSYELAVAWVRKQESYRRSNWQNYKHNPCAVVFFVEFPFSDDSDEFINLDYDLVSEVEKFSADKDIPIEEAYDLYLSRLEKKTGVQIVALQGICPPPKKEFFTGLRIKKSNIAFAIAVMNTKYIKIIKTKDFSI